MGRLAPVGVRHTEPRRGLDICELPDIVLVTEAAFVRSHYDCADRKRKGRRASIYVMDGNLKASRTDHTLELRARNMRDAVCRSNKCISISCLLFDCIQFYRLGPGVGGSEWREVYGAAVCAGWCVLATLAGDNAYR